MKTRFRCTECKDEWEALSGAVKTTEVSCPSCGGSRIRRASGLAYWRPGAGIGDNFLARRTLVVQESE